MSDEIDVLQESQFGGLHAFHTQRTKGMLAILQERFGPDVLKTAERAEVDIFGLHQWHMLRTVALLKAVRDAYGQEAVDVVVAAQNDLRFEQGRAIAAQAAGMTLEDIAAIFAGGTQENIVEMTEDHALVQTTDCMAGRIIEQLDDPALGYALHCGTDAFFVQGLDACVECEVLESIARGDKRCLHRIRRKVEAR